jgi:hypothetical protein
MPKKTPTFRDFGISPDDLQPPPDKVRCFLSRRSIIGQYVSTAVISTLGIGLAVLIAMTMRFPLSVLGCTAVLVGGGIIVHLAIRNDCRWVELENNTLRAEHLYTGSIIERSIEEISSLDTILYGTRSIETVMVEKVLGRVKGIMIRFRDRRRPLQILRTSPAMANAQELIEAVLYRMTKFRELDCEIVNCSGSSLVRTIYWKGDKPSVHQKRDRKGTLGFVALLALGWGIVLGYWGLQEQDRYCMASVAPHEVSLRSLIENGPGVNRHVSISDFRAGGYTLANGCGVWVALFPNDEKPDSGTEIKAVLWSMTIHDKVALTKMLRRGRIDGACEAVPTAHWGGTLGPDLRRANPGSQLVSAWQIHDLSEPPSAALVTGVLAGSVSCFLVGFILAVIFVRMNG